MDVRNRSWYYYQDCDFVTYKNHKHFQITVITNISKYHFIQHYIKIMVVIRQTTRAC